MVVMSPMGGESTTKALRLANLTLEQREFYLQRRAEGKTVAGAVASVYEAWPQAEVYSQGTFSGYERSPQGKEEAEGLTKVGEKHWRCLQKLLIAHEFLRLFHKTVKEKPDDTIRLKHLGSEARFALDSIRDEDLPGIEDPRMQSFAASLIAAMQKAGKGQGFDLPSPAFEYEPPTAH